MKKYEELDITDPFIFAKVMSDKRLCKPLLESILNIKIRDIEYVDYEETKQIDEKVIAVRKNTRWRREYMSLQMEMNLKYREGLKAGEAKGRSEGQDNVNKLNKILLAEKRYDDLEKTIQDKEYQEKFMREYNILD